MTNTTTHSLPPADKRQGKELKVEKYEKNSFVWKYFVRLELTVEAASGLHEILIELVGSWS